MAGMFEGRHIVVTGGTGALGGAVLKRLLGAGATCHVPTSHGSAPDIVGTGKANPTAMLLSTAMMLDWLGARHKLDALTDASLILEAAIDKAYAERIRPFEFGGSNGTADITRAVIAEIEAAK